MGTLLEISRDTYLEGVRTQDPPAPDIASNNRRRSQDAILQVDMAPGGAAAAATVKVGNNAQTMVFVDHLLLGKEDGDWKILSKTFSPQLWEDDDDADDDGKL